MKNIFNRIRFLGLLVAVILLSTADIMAQNLWPQIITANNGMEIKIYKPQTEYYQENTLKFKTVFSLKDPASEQEKFGMFWTVAQVRPQDDQLVILSGRVTSVRLQAETDKSASAYLKATFESQLSTLLPSISLSSVNASIAQTRQEKQYAKSITTTAPEIIYSDKSSLLVVMDGNPSISHNSKLNLDLIVNTPYNIVKYTDGYYYLYGAGNWYRAADATGEYQHIVAVPSALRPLQQMVDKSNQDTDPGYEETASNNNTTPAHQLFDRIIVRTHPAELIQSTGTIQYEKIPNTSLGYAKNSKNDLFINFTTGDYYVLISGRWYTSSDINGPWAYVSPSQLPTDFKNIPQESPKAYVLANVAGTRMAKDAIMNAEIPEIVTVNRNNYQAPSITYDGDARFEPIPGTDLQYAVNTSASVILYGGRYYSVTKGVWYVSDSPYGPWALSTERPEEVTKIPANNPLYNIKYVYVYDADNDDICYGYTPGYLNCYVYGPTIVFGTGYHYNPWWGAHYYPRPWTWGFGMSFDPWDFGWDFGWCYQWGFFDWDFAWLSGGFWMNSWWGPTIHRRPAPFYAGGYGQGRNGFGRGGRPITNSNRIGFVGRPFSAGNVQRNYGLNNSGLRSNNAIKFNRAQSFRQSNNSFNNTFRSQGGSSLFRAPSSSSRIGGGLHFGSGGGFHFGGGGGFSRGRH